MSFDLNQDGIHMQYRAPGERLYIIILEAHLERLPGILFSKAEEWVLGRPDMYR